MVLAAGRVEKKQDITAEVCQTREPGGQKQATLRYHLTSVHRVFPIPQTPGNGSRNHLVK